ncbi:MAG: hypothetical protein R3E12_11425 [Candidatus Eisenbacteria bacterium]
MRARLLRRRGLDPGAGSGLEAGAGSREGRRAVGLGVAGMAAGMATATVLALAPFVLAGNGGYVWRVLIGSVDFQPRLAPGANNVWWLFFGEEAKRIWDGYRYLDALSYRETGLLALAGVALATIVVGAFTIWTSAKVTRVTDSDGPTFAGSGGRTNTEGPTSAGSGGRTNTEGPTSAGSGGRTNTEGPTSAGSRNRSSTGSISSSSGMSSQRQALDANAPVLAWRILFGTSFFLLFAFYVLPTQMHERYVIYCLPPLLFVWVMRTHGAGVLYGLLSVGAFVTIAANLVAAYRRTLPP